MKNQIILLIAFICVSVNGQKTPASFVNYDRLPTDNPLFDYDERISSIQFISDNEFEFWSRPMISCVTWHEYKGNWINKNDTIIFSDRYEVQEADSHFKFSKQSDNLYTLNFKTDKNSNLKNKSIEIQYVYDFGSEIDDIEFETVLDHNAVLNLPFQNIPHLNKLASIRFEIILGNGEKRYGYITDHQVVNKRVKKLPNQITITLIEEPIKEWVYRTTKALYFDGNLKIISTEKTQSKFDNDENLKFKDLYKERSL